MEEPIIELYTGERMRADAFFDGAVPAARRPNADIIHDARARGELIPDEAREWARRIRAHYEQAPRHFDGGPWRFPFLGRGLRGALWLLERRRLRWIGHAWITALAVGDR